ncbi:hypothetical protein J437_LFUL014166 [Ladona fulva]|uniref:DDE-1 domain-containing protein n=1 Tax=Ladona fulva TaxID=123851 RepID=A0A8K0K8K7_LADFU|nr:hypothetical protein J437_LFUL014166 [Ladona fulva]
MSTSQPLDQGIIQKFKIHYIKRVQRHILMTVEERTPGNEFIKSINVLNAILWIISSVKDVQGATVHRCFIKAGFCCNDENNDPVIKSWNSDCEELERLIRKFGGEGNEDFANIDECLFTKTNPSRLMTLAVQF